MCDIELEVKSFKKASTFMNIPTKQLKQVTDVIVEPLMQIWNNEIINNPKFPTKLTDPLVYYQQCQNIWKNNTKVDEICRQLLLSLTLWL